MKYRNNSSFFPGPSSLRQGIKISGSSGTGPFELFNSSKIFCAFFQAKSANSLVNLLSLAATDDIMSLLFLPIKIKEQGNFNYTKLQTGFNIATKKPLLRGFT